MNTTRSQRLYAMACDHLPGGVSSPVRAFRAVDGTPIFFDHGQGAHLVDVDGNSYIDYVCSWGPLIAGHAHPHVVEAVRSAAARGTSFGAPTELELQLASVLKAAMPSIELIRFVNSGTEATMSALRVARAFTSRDIIVKCDGGYHGHADALLVRAGSGALTFGLPDSAGVPAAHAAATVSIPFNDLEAARETLHVHPGQVAALIVEPVAANMGVVPPAPGYLQGLRTLTEEHGALLIFDEVITGFRVAPGGAQELYGVRPDLTCLGKIVGGGLPVGAYGGRRDVMEMVAPLGPVYQAGTLSGNPLAMAAGLATIELLQAADAYEQLETRAAQLGAGLIDAAYRTAVPCMLNRVGSLMTSFFVDEPVTDYASAKRSDTKRYAQFFHVMLERGVYLAPSQFEAAFVSLAHSESDVERTIDAARAALQAV